MPLQFKNLQTELDDVSLKDGLVTAYWSAFGNRDSDGDEIAQGAYAKTIQQKGPAADRPRIKFLWQHDPWSPIGVPTEMAEDARGLRVVKKVAATTQGRDALILYEAGVLTEHSVGFITKERDPEDQAVITEIDLWEGSVVTWGANPLTPFLGMKSADDVAGLGRLREHTARMRKALKAPLTDETAEQLELALGVLDAHLAKAELTVGAIAPDSSASSIDLGALFAKHLVA